MMPLSSIRTPTACDRARRRLTITKTASRITAKSTGAALAARVLRGRSHRVARVLEISGLAEVFDVPHADVERNPN